MRLAAITDLKSKRWIVAKGLMFLFICAAATLLIWIEIPSLKTAFLLTLLIWSSARFYYFLFYVLEKYVDPTMRYAGIWDLMKGMNKRREEKKRD